MSSGEWDDQIPVVMDEIPTTVSSTGGSASSSSTTSDPPKLSKYSRLCAHNITVQQNCKTYANIFTMSHNLFHETQFCTVLLYASSI